MSGRERQTSMLSMPPFAMEGRRTLLLANRNFSAIDAKTASCFLMYRPRDVVAVHDTVHAGRTAGEVLGFGGAVPVVGTIEEALALGPEVAVVGTAPRGGGLDEALRGEIEACLRAGVDVASGLHAYLSDEPLLAAASKASGARVWDVRQPPPIDRVSTGAGCTTGARTVLVVGSDCNVGKMTVALELHAAAQARGIRASWAATGQTGIMLRGRGIPVDAVVSDFIGGAAELLVDEEGRDADVVFVEGQGSIIHPGYAGVTLGLLYGVMPDCMVFAHEAGRDRMKRLDVDMPPLEQVIDLYERLMRPHKPSPVVGVTVNTSALGEAEARRALSDAEAATGRPATDVVRFGCERVLDAIEEYLGRRG